MSRSFDEAVAFVEEFQHGFARRDDRARGCILRYDRVRRQIAGAAKIFRERVADGGALTVATLFNQYLEQREADRDAGTITAAPAKATPVVPPQKQAAPPTPVVSGHRYSNRIIAERTIGSGQNAARLQDRTGV